jgi:hypothetical protein
MVTLAWRADNKCIDMNQSISSNCLSKELLYIHRFFFDFFYLERKLIIRQLLIWAVYWKSQLKASMPGLLVTTNMQFPESVFFIPG